ncbi:MAG: hypothetical protein ACOX5A_07150 [Aminivibrio sp.]|jgi:hypothetical protein
MKNRTFLLLALVLLLSFSGAASVSESVRPDQLRFLSGPPGGNWFALGGALADLWSSNLVSVTAITGGAVANIHTPRTYFIAKKDFKDLVRPLRLRNSRQKISRGPVLGLRLLKK